MLFITNARAGKINPITHYPEVRKALVDEYKNIMGHEPPFISDSGVITLGFPEENRMAVYSLNKDNLRINQDLCKFVQKYKDYLCEGVIEISDNTKSYVWAEFELIVSDDDGNMKIIDYMEE